MPLQPQFFFHDIHRKNLLVFGSLFDNIQVVRYNSDDTENSRVRVPLTYGPKEKWAYRLAQDPNFLNPLSVQLPRMSYELTNIQYAADRMHSNTQKLFQEAALGQRSSVYQPVPYDLSISLFLMSRTQDEALQVVEQIVPFFAPDVTVTMDVGPSLNSELDIPISLIGISKEDTWDAGFEQPRIITWTFDFTMKTYFYGPVRSGKVIETVFIKSRPNIIEP